MILVTVGMHPQGFERLVCAADKMAALIEEPVTIQRGSTRFRPSYAKSFDFVNEGEMQEWLAQARVVVSHSGAGSILSALQAGKPLVAVPRLRRFAEVYDDHQLELAEALAGQGQAVTLTHLSCGTLQEAVEQAAQIATAEYSETSLHGVVRVWLADCVEQRTSGRWERFRRRFVGG